MMNKNSKCNKCKFVPVEEKNAVGLRLPVNVDVMQSPVDGWLVLRTAGKNPHVTRNFAGSARFNLFRGHFVRVRKARRFRIFCRLQVGDVRDNYFRQLQRGTRYTVHGTTKDLLQPHKHK
jgi:hypothetical protein